MRAQGEAAEALSLHELSAHRPEAVWETELGLGSSAVATSSFAGRPPKAAEWRGPRSWWPAKPLDRDVEVFIPVEAAMLRHPSGDTTGLREPLTTGTAAGPTAAEAMRHAARELIERDAYMGAMTERDPLVRASPHPRLADIADRLHERYQLELTLFALRPKGAQSAVMALLLDRSNRSVAVTCGLGCASDFEAASEKALLEAWQPRVWLRAALEAGAHPPQSPANIRTALDRGLYWSHPRQRREAVQLINDVPFENAPAEQHDACDPAAALAADQVSLYVVDMPETSDLPVRRLVAPSLLPMYLDERFAYARRPTVLFPHPFL